MKSTVEQSQEKRTGTERRASEDRRHPVVSATHGAEAKRKYNTPLEVIGSAVAVALGLGVYKATGLYSAADSSVVSIGLGALIASWFVLNFRVALHQK